MTRSHSYSYWMSAACLLLLASKPATAVIPYSPVPVSGPPIVGPGVMPPTSVFGKEYSHDFDFSTIGPAPDPEQVIAWDGVGGTADTVDFTGTRMFWEIDQEVDAIANSRDALFDETTRDEAHLIFSHDDLIAGYDTTGVGGLALLSVPSAGPVMLSNGNVIGGAGEVSVEEAGMFTPMPSVQGLWAKQAEVNGMPLPHDVDGLEAWGPEPRHVEEPDTPVVGDSDKYSLDTDAPSGVSVWNASGSAYIGQGTIATAVESMLGIIPPTAFSMRDEQQGRNAINLDALMVSDIIEDRDFFHMDIAAAGPAEGADELTDQNGEPISPYGHDGEHRGDSIIFSIRQIVDPADPDGYYATGSELFVLDSLGGVSYLMHGGHLWDHGYSLAELSYFGSPDEPNEQFHAVIDINAIEAIGEEQAGSGPVLPGDYNGDGSVDAVDYAVWRDNLGTANPLAGNGNETGPSAGIVDGDDYVLWRSNYGSALPSPGLVAASAAAPEPAAALLMLLAGVGGFAKRRR